MKMKNIKRVYWTVTILFGLFMLFSGISELMMTQQGKDLFVLLGYPLYLNYILGVAKVLGVYAIFQNKFKTLKEWAYAGFTFDIIGASASFALIGGEFIGTIFPLLFLVVMFVSYFTWKKIDQKN